MLCVVLKKKDYFFFYFYDLPFKDELGSTNVMHKEAHSYVEHKVPTAQKFHEDYR